MKYKISYVKDWSKEGTFYDQKVTVKASKSLVRKINREIKAIHKEINSKRIRSNEDMETALFLNPVSEGKNYTHLTTVSYLAKRCGFCRDKRFKTDRNTVVEFA